MDKVKLSFKIKQHSSFGFTMRNKFSKYNKNPQEKKVSRKGKTLRHEIIKNKQEN